MPTKAESEAKKLEAEISEAERTFANISLEYNQIAQNIRESWRLITRLVQQFLLIQIVLLSLVGFGAASITSLVVVNPATQLSLEDAAPQNGDATSSPASSSSSEKTDVRTWSLLEVLPQLAASFMLILVGVVSSWGAGRQMDGLYDNAKEFVARAAALEERLELEDLKASSENGASNTRPHHVYMHRRLVSNPAASTMQQTVGMIFGAGLGVWIMFTLVFIILVGGAVLGS